MDSTSTQGRVKALREAYIALGQDVSRLSDGDLVNMALGRGTGTAPEWARMEAADRVKALREKYARVGEDVPGLSDMDLLNMELERANAESRRHSNAYNSLLQDRVKHDRAVRTAARRSAQNDSLALGGMYLTDILRRSAVPITGLIYRIAELPDRPASKVLDELRAAARSARWQLDGVVSDQVVERTAVQDPGVNLTEKLRAELRRLRAAVRVQGAALHLDYDRPAGSRDNGGRCECPGCELVRSVDDVPEPTDMSA